MASMKTLSQGAKMYDIVDSKARDDINNLTREVANKQPAGNYVKTVNGAAPDQNGNVNVAGGGGNGSSITVDASLTTAGAAADAKATGDAIAEVMDEVAAKQPAGKYVKTVNGAAPDANGNVNVASGGGAALPSVTVEDNGRALVVRNGAWEKMNLIDEVSFTVEPENPNLFNKNLELIQGYNMPDGPIDVSTLEVPLTKPHTQYALYPELIYMKPNTTYAFSADYVGNSTLFKANDGGRHGYVTHAPNGNSQFTAGDNCLLYTTGDKTSGYYLVLGFWVGSSNRTNLENFVIVEGTDITAVDEPEQRFEQYLHEGIKIKGSQIVGATNGGNAGSNGGNVVSDGSYVTPEEFGAYGDGTHDDTAAIQAAIDTDKNVQFAKNATYRITQSLIFTNKHGVTLFGNNATIAHMNSNALGVTTIEGATDCVIRDLNFSSSGQLYDGIYVASIPKSTYFTRCEILNCHFDGQRYGMYLGGYRIRIEECEFFNCNYGIDNDCCNNAVFINNYFHSNTRGLSANIPYFNTFMNNTYHANEYGLYIAGSGEGDQIGCNVIGEVFRSGTTSQPSRHLYINSSHDIHVSGIVTDGGAKQDIGILSCTDCILTGIQLLGLMFIEGTSQRIDVSDSRIGYFLVDAADDIQISSSVVDTFEVKQTRNTGRYVTANNVAITNKVSGSNTLNAIKHGTFSGVSGVYEIKEQPAMHIYNGNTSTELVFGTSDIYDIGDGTVTGAIRAIAQAAGLI